MKCSMVFWAKNRWIAMAAHWALWIAIVSPVVSQTLATPHLPFECGSATALGALDHASDMPGMMMTGPDADHHASDGLAPGDVCGYCSLFAHLPFALAFAASLATLPPLPHPPRAEPSAQPTAWRADFAFESRGPPPHLS